MEQLTQERGEDSKSQASTLDYLLKVEAQAAGLVKDAQDEADVKIHENDEKMRHEFEDRFRGESARFDLLLKEEVERLKDQYRQKLEDYRNEINDVAVDTDKFCVLFNEYAFAQRR